MEQMKVPEKIKIELDYGDRSIPEAVRALRPLVFKDGKTYCAVLGPNRLTGIFGCGPTIQAALEDWEANMRQRLSYPAGDDIVVTFVNDKLNASRKLVL